MELLFIKNKLCKLLKHCQVLLQGEADILRRAMGKKRSELEKQKQRFIEGAC